MRIRLPRLGTVAVLIGLLPGCTRLPPDGELFREALDAGKATPDRQWYIAEEIARSQADHGWCADSAASAAIAVRQKPEYSKIPQETFTRCVVAWAQHGEIGYAKELAAGAASVKAKAEGLQAIALVQAEQGDFNGARNTGRELPDSSGVISAIAVEQAKSGDIEGAQKTAREITAERRDDVLWEIAEQFWKRGDARRAHEIALQIGDPQMRESVETDPADIVPQPKDACDMAWDDSQAGRYREAYEELAHSNCECTTIASVHEEAGDQDGAFGALRTCRSDIRVEHTATLAGRAARKGDIAGALKFVEWVRAAPGSLDEEYMEPGLREVGRAWSKKDLKAAVKWASSLPAGIQRAIALLGVAESMPWSATPLSNPKVRLR